jgi:predicted PurR-regulated permease PerM
VSSLSSRSRTAGRAARAANSDATRATSPRPTVAPPASWDARTIWFANLVVLAVVICFALLFRFAGALFILFAGVAVGMAVRPGVEWLRRHGVTRWIGALALYAVLGCLAAGVLVLAVPLLIEQGEALLARAPHQIERLRNELLASQSHTLQRIAWYLPAAAERGGMATLDVTTLLRYAGALGRNLFIVASVLLLGFYWTLEGDRRVRALALFAPFERRRAIRSLLTDVEHTVGAYLRGQSLVCLVIGVMAFVAYRALGVPHAGIVGLVYALGEAVPVVGPIIGTVTACMVAASVNPSLVVAVIIVAVCLQLFENYLLIPRVMGRTVGTSPLVTLLAITAFGSVLGISGAILAIPMAAIVQLLLYRFWLGAEAQHAAPPVGRDRLSAIRYEVNEVIVDLRRLHRVRGSRRPASTERVEDAVEGIAHDLDQLLAQREARP